MNPLWKLTLAAALMGSLAGASSIRAATADRPNILFLVADDLGWADVSYHGSEIQMPNIDRLARAGVRLERHYVMATCSPTRCGLLSGRFPSRFGVLSPTNSRVFKDDTMTLAKALQSRGYFTGITGKWHLGSKPEWGPLKHGFTASYGALAGGVDQYGHWYKDGPYRQTWHRNDQFVEEEGHSTDLFAREAIRWIEARREQPWYIQVTFTAVHIPLQEPREWLKLYDGKINEPSRKVFAASASHMDHGIGDILTALERTGQRERTLIVFTSDNGGQEKWLGASEYAGGHLPCPVLGGNEPLRGWKGDLYEGGIRVPAFVNWPAKIKPAVVNTPVHIADWFPTLARLAGYAVEPSLKLDGQDVWPIVTGRSTQPPARPLYWKTRGVWAVQQDNWKLIARLKSAQNELFDLAADPYEKQNLAAKHPERVAGLAALLERLKQDDPAE